MKLSDLERYPLADLLVHAAPMILLDRVTAVDEEGMEAEVSITERSEFCEKGQVGAWVGMEYMAQTVAAFSGAEARLAGKPCQPGLLLGTRQYQASVPNFPVGSVLRIGVKKVLGDPQGLSVMECTLKDHASQVEWARASLTVFEVKDFQGFIAAHGSGQGNE